MRPVTPRKRTKAIDVDLANGLAEKMGINARLTLVEVVSDVTAKRIEGDPEIGEGG